MELLALMLGTAGYPEARVRQSRCCQPRFDVRLPCLVRDVVQKTYFPGLIGSLCVDAHPLRQAVSTFWFVHALKPFRLLISFVVCRLVSHCGQALVRACDHAA